MTTMQKTKTYLAVPFEKREEAKEHGAKWDKKEKAWFVVGDDVPPKLQPLLNAAPAQSITADPQQEFGQFLRDRGALLQGAPVMDGHWHRVALEGDGKEKNASYRGFSDGVPNGQFHNFRGTGIEQWKGTGPAQALSPEEKARRQAEAEKTKQERQAELQDKQQAAAKRAFGIWANLATWATPKNCPYLARKNVRGYGVKLADDGRMVIPLRDETGRIWSLQFIGDEKTYLKESRKDGLWHSIDPERKLDAPQKEGGQRTILICEGYATGADIHAATKLPTVVAFDGDNLISVAKSVRAKYPDANILIAADNDHHLPLKAPPLPNKGLECAGRAAEAVGGRVLAPSFTQEEKERGATDWNDLKHLRGPQGLIEAMRSSFRTMQQVRLREQALSTGRELERSL